MPRTWSQLRRKGFSSVGALCATLLLGGCGAAGKHEHSGTYAGEGGVPAPIIYAGPLAYEVQLSRQLNPAEAGDRTLLAGLTPAQAQLPGGEEWLAVFLQVYNESGRPQMASGEITLYDTDGNSYQPVLPAGENPFAYGAASVPAHGRLPEPDSVAAESPSQGAVLLFKIKLESLASRPITIRIADPADPALLATAELDI